MGSTFDGKHDWILALRRQNLKHFREKKCIHALRYLEPARSEQRGGGDGFFLRKRLTIIDLCESLWSVGTRFRR